MRSATIAGFLAIDRLADLAASLANAAADVPGDLVRLALRTHFAVAARAADDLLRDALHLLSNALYFLFGCLSAESRHPVSSLRARNKQEPFRQLQWAWMLDNAETVLSRLKGQQT
jgi:hypothetical protein